MSSSHADLVAVAYAPPPSYSTTEVCETTGASRRQVTYWAARGLIPGQPTVMGTGRSRRWLPEQVDVVRQIFAANAGAEVRHLRKALREVCAERDALRLELRRITSLEQLVELGSPITRLRSALAGHHPCDVDGVPQDCYLGDCDHDDVCPEVTFVCCAACLAIAREIDGEMIPAVVFAENCPACVAFVDAERQL